jgi:hypothetical protein
MFCHKCGIELDSKDKFCYKCGANVISTSILTNNINKNSILDIREVSIDVLPEVKIKKICRFSIISFVLSFILVFGSIPALILSILSLKRIKKSESAGKGLAITALIISGLTLFFFIVIVLAGYFSKLFSSSKGGFL